MGQFKTIWGIAVLAGTAVMAAGCTATPPAQGQDSGYYVINPDNEVYKDGKGNCWHVTDAEKTPADYREECGDQIATAPVDSDGDGVFDDSDQCPNTPRGTEVDARGCPIEEQAPIVLRGVTFEFDKATLTSQAEDRLDNVVNALMASSELMFRIDGYTDSVGSQAYNQDLSQRRVESVRAYLVDNGISTSRITATRGHGESNPVATNETAAGRAQNRRVELNVISN